MTEAKLDLIAKLLAKAESTTPEEAEALTEHAERLIVKYGIDQARIDERRGRLGQTQEQIVQERMLFSGVYARDLQEIGSGVAQALGTVRPLGMEVPVGAGLLLVGYASDVTQVRTLTASLEVQAMVAMRKWWSVQREIYHRHTESEKRRARSGFLRGFARGVMSRIQDSRRTIVENAGTGTALVLTSRRDRVDEAVDAMATTRARPRRHADAGAFAFGHRSGREARTGERGHLT
ncbi:MULTISPECIES: DUF2786 domain-containing protein [unclassified Microbacterium]|uniref:DUF2786 domain-containing protein n=1 Tax=unclassified Microbacterium TaxID=2609290 RepID=UPI000D000294|nr:DUF2786 domain-containing protein [Microbacterium sp. MYb45]PRB58978.1 hypothetical protein CQ034_15610 [Microbacterium sp. MYb45]